MIPLSSTRCLSSSSSPSTHNKHKHKSKKKKNTNKPFQPTKQQKQQQQIQANRKLMKRQPNIKVESENSKEAPPLFLYQTASPSVYISSIAIDNSYSSFSYQDDNNDGHDHNQCDDINIYRERDGTRDAHGESNDDEFNNSQTNNNTNTIVEQPTPIHPKSLFTETKPPQSFTNSTFEYVSPKLFHHELPTDTSIPEIAFLGRSNVGKSSLLNAITGNGDLARISKTPGRTQQVNYFGQFVKSFDGVGGGSNNEDRNLVSTPPIGYIIDLPGYGKV